MTHLDFSPARWEQIRQTAAAWWRDELDRPLIAVTANGFEPRQTPPAAAPRFVDAAYDFGLPAANVVDAWDWRLSQQRYLGDAFPTVRPNFGPGHNAVFSGARPDVRPTTVWFHPAPPSDIAALSVALDREHPWLQRLRELYRAAADRWQGRVCLGMSDITPNLDPLASLRGTDRLLFDLYDAPEEVDRLVGELHHVFWQTFDLLDAIIRPANPGWTAWDQIFSGEPYLMQQCDFCYMISPAMFERFVLPDLRASCRRLTNSFYHLDGVGQLPHLDLLLSIEELDGIQWIPGAGQPDYDHWCDLYRRIRAAGKKVQLCGPSLVVVDRIADALGSLRGFVIMPSCPAGADLEEIARWLATYGVPAVAG
jgi:5-methyltetrahydrofolate--homocysteine methyltransferase